MTFLGGVAGGRAPARAAAVTTAAALTFALTFALTQAPAGAAPPVEHPDPGRLVRGVDARVPYLQDGVVRANGRQLRVRVPYADGKQTLLGRSRKGWLVASGTDGVVRVHRVRRGRAPRLVPRGRHEYPLNESRGVRLAVGGERLVWTGFNRGGSETWVRRVGDGRRVGGKKYSLAFGKPLDAVGQRVLTIQDDPDLVAQTVVWRPGVATRVLGGGSAGGSLADDVLFVPTGDDVFGPTSIRSPGAPAWSARFAMIDLSPSGDRVLGIRAGRVRGRNVLQVRRMSDGVVLRQWTYGSWRGDSWSLLDRREETARFETDSKVVFEVRKDGRSALVRCRVHDGCTRASQLGGAVSFPRDPFIWWATGD